MIQKVTVFLLLLLTSQLLQAQSSLNLFPLQDNTLYQDANGTLSNGGGDYLFVGETRNVGARRTLIQFDLTDLPAGVTITDVALTLSMNKNNAPGNSPVALHAVSRSWGEGTVEADGEEGRGGTAQTGDATWLHAFSDTAFWDNPGGDFNPDASAMVNIDGNGTYQWTSPEMLNEVIDWYNDPSSNHGWILIGQEGGDATAMRFGSREASSGRPELTITYTTSTQISLAEMGLQIYPIPVTDRLTLDLKGANGLVEAELSTLQGQSLSVKRWTGGQKEYLNLSELPKGVYLLHLTTERGTRVERITKQ